MDTLNFVPGVRQGSNDSRGNIEKRPFIHKISCDSLASLPPTLDFWPNFQSVSRTLPGESVGDKGVHAWMQALEIKVDFLCLCGPSNDF